MNKGIASSTITILSMAVLSSAGRAADRWTFTPFDVPGSVSNAAFGLNGDGAVVGTFLDGVGKQHGYLLSGGTFTTIDYPGAMATQAVGISSNGDIVGYHQDASGMPGGGYRGYLLRQGNFTDINHPTHLNTMPTRITDGGLIVGCVHDTDTMGTMHGFLYSNGDFSTLDMGASMNNGVMPDGSLTAGLVTDMMTNMTHGYLAGGGNLATFDFPFSTSTQAWDLSASGKVVGAYTDAGKKTHGFLLILDDPIATLGVNPQVGVNGAFSFMSIDYPGAAGTQTRGINNRGDVVGFYTDSAGKNHSFFLSRSHGHD